MLKILPIGLFVSLKTGDVPQRAQIAAVEIRAGGVARYEVVWWSGKTRNSAWVEPGEIGTADIDEKTLQPIGFHPEQ